MLDLASQRICVTGGGGFLGRCVCRQLRALGLPKENLIAPRRREYDLTQEADVVRLYETTRPDLVIHLAAEVGGIGANMVHPGRFFYANMAMGLHLVENARRFKIRKFVHVGTVCAYPKFAPVPFHEDALWDGYPEETNAPYGVAKKAIFVMLDAYQREYALASAVVVPVNLYGPGDNFDPASSHVIPALIRKCEAARLAGDRQIVCWGTGAASREFLYVDDAAAGIVQAAAVMELPVPINLGTGQEISVFKLAETIAQHCDFQGEIVWDTSKPDGQPRRCLDVSRAQELLGWKAQMPWSEGLKHTVHWWREQSADTAECAPGQSAS
jgi:GDP-L-fucose synthase